MDKNKAKFKVVANKINDEGAIISYPICEGLTLSDSLETMHQFIFKPELYLKGYYENLYTMKVKKFKNEESDLPLSLIVYEMELPCTTIGICFIDMDPSSLQLNLRIKLKRPEDKHTDYFEFQLFDEVDQTAIKTIINQAVEQFYGNKTLN